MKEVQGKSGALEMNFFFSFTDILAKAFFSSIGPEISPTAGNYDDNPLQVRSIKDQGTYSFWKSGKIRRHFYSQGKVREFGIFFKNQGKIREF